MRSILSLRNSRFGQAIRPLVKGMIVTGLTVIFALAMSAQCGEHPDKKTALIFNNETRFELPFFVDDEEDGVTVASRTLSNEVEVESGEHFLRARALVKGESVWVWVVNEVPAGQVCTWTVTDPSTRITAANNTYRTAIAAPSRRMIKGKRRE